jgi:hypothetical protein
MVFAVDPYALRSILTGGYNDARSPERRNARPFRNLRAPRAPAEAAPAPAAAPPARPPAEAPAAPPVAQEPAKEPAKEPPKEPPDQEGKA